MKRSGFVKIIESIIAAIILLSSVSYFFSVYIKPSEWSSVMLEINGRDAVSALEKSGMLANYVQDNNYMENSFGLGYAVRKLLPRIIDFTIEMENLPKSQINIGCACDEIQLSRLKKMLSMDEYSNESSLLYGGRRINLSIDDDNRFLWLISRDDIDVVVIFDYVNLSFYSLETENFLDKGKAIIAVIDMNQSVLDNYSERVFNISWRSGTPGNENYFNDLATPGNLSRIISNYFISTTSRVFTGEPVGSEKRGYMYINGIPREIKTGFNSSENYYYVNYSSAIYRVNETFVIDAWTINVTEVESSLAYADLRIIDRSYMFNITNIPGHNNISSSAKTLLSDGLFSSSQANFQISQNGNGRSVWLKDYDGDYNDMNQFFGAVLLWATSEKYDVFENIGQKKFIPEKYERVGYLVCGNLEPSPYAVSLLMWYIF